MYLSIPSLESKGTTLQEGTDYSIKDNSRIFFPSGTLSSLFEEEFGTVRKIFNAPSSLILSPVLTSIYLKGLGATDKFYKTLSYEPFIENFNSQSSLDKNLMIGEHYKYLT